MCVSLKSLLCYFSFIVVNYEATLREQKAIEIESKFDGYKTITDRNNTRTTFAQISGLQVSTSRHTHIYTHTCINYTYTHMTSTYHIRFVFLCTFFGFIFLYFFRTFRDRQCFVYVVV